MYCNYFTSCVAIAAIFGFPSAPSDSEAERYPPSKYKRNSALDAALSAQSATTFIVCTVSFQTRLAAYALGIGSLPIACVAPSSSALSPSSSTPTIPDTIKPPTIVSPAVDNADAFIPCSPTNPSSCEFMEEALSGHNKIRATHHVASLMWNDTLAQSALRWAQNGKWGHSNQTLYNVPYGENLFAKSTTYPGVTMDDAMYAFNSEEALYDYRKPGFSEATGHFTQVVWKGTTQVGCTVANVNLDVFSSNSKSSAYFVCHFWPAGNWIGQFAENVLAP